MVREEPRVLAYAFQYILVHEVVNCGNPVHGLNVSRNRLNRSNVKLLFAFHQSQQQ